MSVKNVQTTWACDWVHELAEDPDMMHTYCDEEITQSGRDPVKVLPPKEERDLIGWSIRGASDKPDRHFCPKHARQLKAMGV